MENPLHLAVLNEDFETLQQLSKNSKLRGCKNSLGFTALELARFLGKDQCIEILSPNTNKEILVIKPGEHKITKFTPELFTTHFNIKYRSHLNFRDYDFLKQMIKNCPWTLHTSFLGEENRAQAITFRKELSTGHIAPTTIQWIDNELGYGLFARTNLAPGTFVGEFTGVVRRLYRLSPDQNEYCFHYPTRFWSWNYTIIDAIAEGNETRFINHSDTPNLKPICLCERRLLHTVFMTNSFVKAGTQLTYNYGKDFWKHRTKNES